MRSFDTWADKVLTHGRPHVAKPHLFHVALVEPEIPQNTGNIGRTCVGTHSDMHLIGDLGFRITDKNLKRAGLDYWEYLTWTHHPDIATWQKEIQNPKRVFYFSAKADKSYYDVDYQIGDWFVFGKETKGLPDDLMQSNKENCLLIPLLGPARGLNVATAVAVVLYEAIGQLHRRKELDPSFLDIPWGKL
ncbi:MAG: tRNA (cytidine(34)-2'-O)-methyltransferase [Oligoflexia bacterium]|nr:MAG: tRNA (cytidine(34)-2'-O)-methyltransferase [Oligoflexia bacterium]